MGAMKPWHWVVIIILLVVIFGAGKLPEIARNLGLSAKVLKKEMKELSDDDTPATTPQPPTQAPQQLPASQQPGVADTTTPATPPTSPHDGAAS